MARTLLHLGAELISSDGIAFYELIKNSFDARSPKAEIDVVVALPHDLYLEHVKAIESARAGWAGDSADDDGNVRDDDEDDEDDDEEGDNTADEVPEDVDDGETEDEVIARLARAVIKDLAPSAPNTRRIRNRLRKSETWTRLLRVVDQANYIDIRDTGTGMSKSDLTEVYLTIGTRSRLEDDGQPDDGKPVLGEKGIGRLSVMRLGSRVRIQTSRAGEARWNKLEIDWKLFDHNSTELIQDVPVEPKLGRVKDHAKESGTRVLVLGLRSRWSAEKLVSIATEEFSRLTNPFTPKSRYPVALKFNGQPVPIPQIDKLLFAHAHAIVKARYDVGSNGRPSLQGSIEYLQRRRTKPIDLDVTDLVGITTLPVSVLESLGSFSVEFYWFNRGALEAVDGIGDKRTVQKLVNQWSGGLMVFRDGFRVNPYGSHDDDWLDLDKTALASAGYKVNRKQVVGRVEISKEKNSSLVDQTNREGLRDSDEKTALVLILKHLLESQFRVFLNTVDNEVRARVPVKFSELSERLEAEEKEVRRALKELYRKHPKLRDDEALVDSIDGAVEKIAGLVEETNDLADEFERGRRQLVDLAGLGLMVEILAHELSRATLHALNTLNDTDLSGLPKKVGDRLKTLRDQLRTLQKRLEILDPLGITVRQSKQTFDLVDWVKNIVSAHEAQFARHGITCEVVVEPRGQRELTVKMVKGMIVQILENLLANSVYWLKLQRKLDKKFRPTITIVVDTRKREIRLADNGPGIPVDRIDDVFQPFVTTKPPGEGKGLGLFISREIAEYHDAQLLLTTEPKIHANRANTFHLMLAGSKHQ